ncbi:MAG TPA: hypothetical protein DG048_17625 [Pseudoalteromonas sp.]|nr:hypothetical protein [Pseudoalteromonas sp.]
MLPNSFNDFISPSSVKTPELRISLDSTWVNESIRLFSNQMVRVVGISKVLQMAKLSKQFESVLRSDVILSDLIREAQVSIPSNWYYERQSNEVKTLFKNLINNGTNKHQLRKMVKRELQSLHQVAIGLSCFDVFLRRYGIDLQLEDFIDIRPSVFSIVGFSKELYTQQFKGFKNRARYVELKMKTLQFDETYLKISYMRKNDKFFRQLIKGESGTAITVERLMDYLVVSNLCTVEQLYAELSYSSPLIACSKENSCISFRQKEALKNLKATFIE